MRKITAIVLCLLLLLLLAACGNQTADTQETTAAGTAESSAAPEEEAETVSVYPYTFTDAEGVSVTLTEKPQKVAVLFSSYAEIWTKCGGEIAVTVGDSVTRGFVSEDVVLVNDGAGFKLDMEALIAAEPDFVIATADLSAQAEAVETLRELGIPAAALREENFSDYLNILQIFADLNENPDAVETLGTDVHEAIYEIISSAQEELEESEPVSYLFIRAGSAFSSTKAKTAEDHFACVILDDLGGVNIADDAGALADELSLEAIIERQPDVIIVVAQGDEEAAQSYVKELFASDGWQEVNAIRDGSWCFVSKDLFNYKPNDRWADAYRTMYGILYPDTQE